MRQKRFYSIAQQIRRSFVLLIVFLVAIATGYSVFSEMRALSREIDSSISDYAYLLSHDDRVRAMLEANAPDTATIATLDTMLAQLNKVDMLVVANTDSIRLYHPEKFRIGQAFVGGDQHAILEGAAPYITEGYGTRLHQRRAFSGVHNQAGEVVGFVMVSAYSIHIQDMRGQIWAEGLLFFLVALAGGSGIALLLSRSIKNSLLGYEPEQITRLYLQNERILDSLEEGLVAVAADNEELYTNAAARQMLTGSYPGATMQETIRAFEQELFGAQQGTRGPLHGRELALECGATLVDAIPVLQQDEQTGTVYILRNKAEQQKLAEQLTGVNHIVAALRANSHEHLNKLHVVLGLLKMQDIETATQYIEQIKEEEEEDNSVVLQRIGNKTIAALILGKKRRAKERDMRLTLRKDSYLNPAYERLSTNELVTVIGNLLENAMDAAESAREVREITLYLYCNPVGTIIAVDDTGEGMTSEQIALVMQGAYTTKGEGHGIGLQLVRQIVQKYNGVMEIESEPGEGTFFTITFENPEREQA